MPTAEEKKAQRQAAARKGGIAAHAMGVAHEFKKGSEAAREAGRKGGAIHAAKMAARRATREHLRVLEDLAAAQIDGALDDAETHSRA